MMAEIVNLNDYRLKRLQMEQDSQKKSLTCQVDLLVEELKKIIADVKLVNH